MDDNNLECYICLDPISNNINANTYVLECCNNSVHLDCLQQWYSTNKTNPNCFICNQHNTFCKDLITPITDSSYILIPINNIESVEIPITRQVPIREKIINITIRICSFLVVIVATITICIIVF